jgi:predicted phosphate transport protein (TIGR00153 family)
VNDHREEAAGPRGLLTALGGLLRARDREFYDLFERAAANVVRAAELMEEMLIGFPDSRGLARDILICEQDGDHITHEVIRRINETFVTPIDRDDILRLTSALDDIVDYIEEVADYLGLYQAEAPMVQAQGLAHVLVDATRELAAAFPLMREFKDVSGHIVEVNRLENEGDRIVRNAIASLFEEGIDPMVVIRWKDIFERLEDAIDATERAAYVLEGVVIKNA